MGRVDVDVDVDACCSFSKKRTRRKGRALRVRRKYDVGLPFGINSRLVGPGPRDPCQRRGILLLGIGCLSIAVHALADVTSLVVLQTYQRSSASASLRECADIREESEHSLGVRGVAKAIRACVQVVYEQWLCHRLLRHGFYSRS